MALKEFAEFLLVKQLAKETVKTYLRNYLNLETETSKHLEDLDLTQQEVNQFLIKHPNAPSRASLSNIFEFYDLHLKLPKLTGRKAIVKHRSISPQEIKVLGSWIKANKQVKYWICFELSYRGGLRREEVLKIKVRDFDLERWVEDTSNPCRLKIKGKGNKERIIPIPKNIMMEILDYVQDKIIGIDALLIHADKSTWHKHFKHAVKSCCDYNYTLHDLRRSRATLWHEEGKNLVQIKNRLGHASVSTTQKYINVDEEKELKTWEEEIK